MPAIGNRFIDADKLLERIGFKPESALAKWLRRQPRTPKLVNGQGAAEILGVYPPHLSRYKHRLNPVSVSGSRWDLYDEDEVKRLRKELDAERAERKAPSK
jgi:hypothetical protein